MRVRTRELLQLCIEQGIAAGYAKAHKHEEFPSEHVVCVEIELALWDALNEYFDFEEQHARKD